MLALQYFKKVHWILAGVNKNLRVILMSATANAGLFASYFKELNDNVPAPTISIPGFTYPVTDYYLDDIFEMTGYQVGKSSKWAKKSMKLPSKSDTMEISVDSAYSPETMQSLSFVDETLINTDLVEILVAQVIRGEISHSTGKKDLSFGSILIFVPGADMIGKLVRILQTSSKISSLGVNILALPLHGGLPPSQQNKVFDRPPPGTCKIVISTNVAETSITIDDITCVIDSGKAKEVRFDAAKGISRLQEVLISQASCLQRRGRAGRVKPGKCYRLVSKSTWSKMSKDTLPEISRSPLQALVMDTKGIIDGNVFQILLRMLTPPPEEGLKQAVISLERMGAIDPNTQELTALGKHLSRMPCDPRLGKMLIFGALLRCLDPVLTIVAAQAFGKPIFWSSPDNRDAAESAKRQLIEPVISSKSDHIAIILAYNGWRELHSSSGRRAASLYCSKWYISEQAMDSIQAGRRQYADILTELGFVPSRYSSVACRSDYIPPVLGTGNQSSNKGPFDYVGGVDEYSGHARVVKAALASGFYPQLLRVENPAAQFQKVQGGAMETEGSAAKVKFFDRDKGRVFLHPSSLNFSIGKFESGWLVYSDIVQTSKIFVRESTMVPVYSVLLFGGDLTVHHEQGLLKVDDWAAFKAPARIAVLVRELRLEVAQLLERKVVNPAVDLSKSKLIDAMHHLLSTDGF